MAEYSPKRSRNLYRPGDGKTFKLSRSKIDTFINCPRCFYVDRRLGIRPPEGFPFNLNSAVDELLKREFDQYRSAGQSHPLIEKAGIEAIPYSHEDLDKWRANFTGIQYLHERTNLLLHGAIDDVWQDAAGDLIVVDYKATSKNGPVSIDADWQIAYKRQMEFYQWLLRQNNFTVSDTGYFIYCNGIRDKDAFNGVLEFTIDVIPYTGNDEWVEGTILDAYTCLNSDTIPPPDPGCELCRYNEVMLNLSEDWAVKGKIIIF